MKRRYLIATSFIAAFLPLFTHAQVVITEIMYDLPTGSDSGREWIEVFNSSSQPVDLGQWRLFEANTNHKLTAVIGTSTIAGGAYVILAADAQKFMIDHASFSGTLLQSPFSLNNSGEELSLRCCGKIPADKDTVAYTPKWGAAGDGNSLQRLSVTGSSFEPRIPSPGAAISADKITPPIASKTDTKTVAKTKKSTGTGSAIANPSSDNPDVSTQADASRESAESPVLTSKDAATSSVVWWLAGGFIALLGAGLVVALQRQKSNEWEIIEETPEEV